ncbi:hypothetical protein DCAR_0418154 [Daucus carota subsp. sativus]|uniref:EXPERA domain-containing protein n=1 Tax=Daucus carota subsp. sativus TaxID=79200 RepID=A0A162AEI0_DAUCS|nr:PREDICTED: transmembrane protein 97-like [Daucus carota subsp. sativus]WOG98809.1 hypothetical protein DCAR_0418154 [Daucus carota subsp. sativus]
MGSLTKLIDAVLFLFFLVIAVAAPVLDFQTCLPRDLYPDALVNLKKWYADIYGDYLVAEKPHFFVGIVWVELLFQWPLSIAALYGILGGKSWVRTVSLMYGSSTLTAMVAILAEMRNSGKASEKLFMLYYPFLGFALLAILRGLLPHSGRTTTLGKRPLFNRKKRA